MTVLHFCNQFYSKISQIAKLRQVMIMSQTSDEQFVRFNLWWNAIEHFEREGLQFQ